MANFLSRITTLVLSSAWACLGLFRKNKPTENEKNNIFHYWVEIKTSNCLLWFWKAKLLVFTHVLSIEKQLAEMFGKIVFTSGLLTFVFGPALNNTCAWGYVFIIKSQSSGVVHSFYLSLFIRSHFLKLRDATVVAQGRKPVLRSSEMFGKSYLLWDCRLLSLDLHSTIHVPEAMCSS